MRTQTLLIALLLLLSGRAAAALASTAPDWLPADQVLTNLVSPTGRIAFLLLRAPSDADIAARAARMASAVGATATARAGDHSDLWVIVLEHPSLRVSAQRLGHELRVRTAPLLQLPASMSRLIKLSGSRPENDYDQELLLQAKNQFSDPQSVPADLVSLAQGSAARIFLRSFAQGDDLTTALFGHRNAPLLMAHPDARLLLALLPIAEQALEIEPPPLPAPVGDARLIGPPAPPRPAWSAALDRAAAVVAKAKATKEVHHD